MKLLKGWAAAMFAAAALTLLAPPGTSLARGFQTQQESFQGTGSTQFASTPSPTGARFRAPSVPQFSTTAPSTNIVRPDYILGPNDIVTVSVFDVPALNRTAEVDSEGNVLLPLIGEVHAGGLTVEELSNKIERDYGAKYVRNPQVTVAVRNSASHKVTVDGAVMQPGIYPITAQTTLMQVIALAKGPNPKLASNRVVIFRTVGQRRTQAVFNLASIRDGNSTDPQVQPNDVVVVDTSGIRKFIQDISPIAPFAALGAIF